jgi:hypothetical protein
MIAHAVVVDPRTGRRFERGDTVPAGLPGEDALIDAGSLRDEPYEEEQVTADPDIAVVMSSSDVENLTKSAREELEKKGLLRASVNGDDGGNAGEVRR